MLQVRVVYHSKSDMKQLTAGNSLAGEYIMDGPRGGHTRLRLGYDHQFIFFYSQDGVERTARGSWQRENDTIVLSTGTPPGDDFALADESLQHGSDIRVGVQAENPVLHTHVHCRIEGGGRSQQQRGSRTGVFTFSPQSVESITLIFDYCPEKKTVFRPARAANQFDFRFEPWIMEVFFHHWQLRLQGTSLLGSHPLLDGEKWSFKPSN